MADERDLALYLTLAPEFGGTRFGPFEEVEVRLGHAQGNDITLPEALGVLDFHVKVLREPGMGLIVAPVERAAGVFVWKAGAHRPSQIHTAVAVQSGDAFALVTESGPKFIVELAKLPDDVLAKRKGLIGGGRELSKGAMADEVKRQAFARVFATGVGQLFMRAKTFVTSGAILKPRNIIAGVFILGGYIAGAATWIGSMDLESKLSEKEEEVETLQSQVDLNASSGTSIKDYKLSVLAANITGIGALGTALDDDPALAGVVKQKAATLLRSKDYAWLTNDPAKNGTRVRSFTGAGQQMVDAGVPPEVARILAFASVHAGRDADGWRSVEDSAGELMCGLGPMALTYRQARSLGLDVVPDALVRGDPSEYQGDASREKRLAALRNTAMLGGISDPPELDGEIQTTLVPLQQGTQFCLALEGVEDQRSAAGAISRALGRHLGEDASHLPSMTRDLGVTARVARVFAGDLEDVDYNTSAGALDLSDTQVGVVMDRRGGPWVLARTGETIAKSMVLPCQALLNTGQDEALIEVFGELPDVVSCLVMDWKLRNEQ